MCDAGEVLWSVFSTFSYGRSGEKYRILKNFAKKSSYELSSKLILIFLKTIVKPIEIFDFFRTLF